MGTLASNQTNRLGQRILIHPDALTQLKGKTIPMMVEHGRDPIFSNSVIGYVNFIQYYPVKPTLSQIKKGTVSLMIGFTLTDSQAIEAVNTGRFPGLSASWSSSSPWVNPQTKIVVDDEINMREVSICETPVNPTARYRVSSKSELLKESVYSEVYLSRVQSEDSVVITDDTTTIVVDKEGVVAPTEIEPLVTEPLPTEPLPPEPLPPEPLPPEPLPPVTEPPVDKIPETIITEDNNLNSNENKAQKKHNPQLSAYAAFIASI